VMCVDVDAAIRAMRIDPPLGVRGAPVYKS
jgi:hypothetical protein